MKEGEGMVFEGCTAISCVRQLTGKRTYSSYQIEEECKYARDNTCSFKKPRKVAPIEVKGPEQKAS